MTGHGFRHMASTLLNEMGFNPDAIERQLGHKQPGVRGVYNKAQYLPERRKMMQVWADYLDGLRDGKKSRRAAHGAASVRERTPHNRGGGRGTGWTDEQRKLA